MTTKTVLVLRWAQEAQAGGVAIADPEVEVAILIPVGDRNRASVVGEVESAPCGDVGKPSVAGVEEDTIALVAAEGLPGVDHGGEIAMGAAPGRSSGGALRIQCFRHDLPPEETSQVAGVAL